MKAEQAKEGKPTPRYWDLLDDLAVGLDRLGKHESRRDDGDKLKQQQDLGMTGRDLYASYANLGTFLILWQIDEGFADTAKAKARVGESIQLIHKAVEVKPDAHFGREMWQAVLEEFLVASLDNPDVILTFDMIGDRLDETVNLGKPRVFKPPNFETGEWRNEMGRNPRWNDGNVTPEQVDQFRNYITLVGAEDGWADWVPTDFQTPVPLMSLRWASSACGATAVGPTRISPWRWARSCCASGSATLPGLPTSVPHSSRRRSACRRSMWSTAATGRR